MRISTKPHYNDWIHNFDTFYGLPTWSRDAYSAIHDMYTERRGNDVRHGSKTDCGHALFRMWFEEYRLQDVWEVESPPPPPPVRPPGEFRRPEGEVRIAESGLAISDDKGLIPAFGIHMGDHFSLYTRDPEWAEEEAVDCVNAGYWCGRVWTDLVGDYWDDLGRAVVATQNLTKFDRYASMMDRVGMRLMLSRGDLFRMNVRQSDRIAMTRDVASVLKVFPNLVVSVDTGNENGNNIRDMTIAKQVEVMEAFLDVIPVSVRSLTDSPEHDLSKWHHDICTVWDVHGYRRGHFWDKIRHIFSLLWEGSPPRRLGIQSEPFGAYTNALEDLVSVDDNDAELDNPEVMALSMLMMYVFRQWAVFFSNPGVSIRRRGAFARQPGFLAIPRAMNAIPPRVMRFDNLAHGGVSQRGERIFAADPFEEGLRADQTVSSTGEAVVMLYGPSGTYNVDVERDITGKILNPATATWSEEMTLRRGDKLPLTMQHGRLFLGKVA